MTTFKHTLTAASPPMMRHGFCMGCGTKHLVLQMDDLERVVKDTAAAIDRHIMTTMLEKHSFAAHCNAVKRYLLLGQVRACLQGCCIAKPSSASLP